MTPRLRCSTMRRRRSRCARMEHRRRRIRHHRATCPRCSRSRPRSLGIWGRSCSGCGIGCRCARLPRHYLDILDATFNAASSVASTALSAAPPRQPAARGAVSVSFAVAGAVPEAGSRRPQSTSADAFTSQQQPSPPASSPPAPPHRMPPRGVPPPISGSVAGAASASDPAHASQTAAAEALLQKMEPPPPAAPPSTSPRPACAISQAACQRRDCSAPSHIRISRCCGFGCCCN